MSAHLEIEIKRKSVPPSTPSAETVIEQWQVPCMLIPTPTAPKQVPHPLGSTVQTFATLEEALQRVHQAGYVALYEGKRFAPPSRATTPQPKTPPILTQQQTFHMQQALQQALPLVLERLQDREPACLAQALQTLAAYPSEPLPESVLLTVVQASYHDNPEVRTASVHALAQWFAADANRLLLLLSQQLSKAQMHPSQSETQRQRLGLVSVLAALAEQGFYDELVPLMQLLLHALSDDYWLIRSTALTAVTSLKASEQSRLSAR